MKLRRFGSAATLRAVVVGAAVFWAPALLLRSRLGPDERFHAAIAIHAVLVPAALLAVWRAWFDAPTRAERLARWVRLALLGPYLGAVAIGAITYFAGPEFDAYRTDPRTPSASGLLLPLALVTVRPGQIVVEYSMFAACAVLVVATLFVPKGAHRPVE
ncbi:MAG TPA: hypothetical protein VKE69_09890 [Planctomycetota bacterium]|nr:hypothetical protein [Planctomycetota bacterium]